ncbi:ATP-binding cassette domain-containing protein [Zoogloeaceae bacterium G21618-S1]|nr:ATP-binding cassette domain-containing protein [Zoogloeaceae bacterium G21618-S1]
MSLFPLQLRDVVFRPNGRAVLDGVDLTLSGEGITVVLGPNGAGKSVLLRTICGLLPSTGGVIDWGGGSFDPLAVGMVFQHPVMLRSSVIDNIALGLVPRGIGARERRMAAMAMLEQIGLADRASDNARQLSGGEQQRLALGRVWLTRPRLLLLDEPTSSLDPSAVEAVERIVRQIRTEGTKILMTTHNLGQATRLADDIVFLAGGRVREHVSVRRFFSQPASVEARQFIQGELPWHLAF